MEPALTPAPPVTSVLFMAYQQERLVQDAIHALLTQEGGPFEIVLSDDCSTDGTYEAMARAIAHYRGPHIVVLRRNERNRGIGGHFNALVTASRGELLVVAAGDDISLPHRTRTLESTWLASGRRLDLIASPLVALGEDGRPGGTIAVDDLAKWRSVDDWLAHRPRVIGAGHAWTRRLFERFGPLSDDIAYEDQVLAFRAICSGGAATLPQALVQYRSGGTSGRQQGRNVAERLRRIELQNRRHLAELHQLLSDAARTPHQKIVQAGLAPELAKQDFLRALLAAPDLAALGRTALRPTVSVPPSWRWRKFWSIGAARLALGRRDRTL